jgi:hypothetical protein
MQAVRACEMFDFFTAGAHQKRPGAAIGALLPVGSSKIKLALMLAL